MADVTLWNAVAHYTLDGVHKLALASGESQEAAIGRAMMQLPEAAVLVQLVSNWVDLTLGDAPKSPHTAPPDAQTGKSDQG